MESREGRLPDEDEPLVLSQLRDLIECTICLEVYTDPVALPCQHTFCRQCLHDIWSRSDHSRTVPCPMCRKEVTVSGDGLAALEKDFKMNRLIEIYQSESLPEASKVTTSCPFHHKKFLDVYCRDCMEVTCSSCFIGKHSGHRGSDVGESVDEVRKQLEREIDLLSCCVVRSLDRQTRRRGELFRFLDEVTTVEAEINAACDRLKQTVDAHRDELLDGLSENRTRMQRELEESDRELDECVAVTEAFKTHCCKMKARAAESVDEICWIMKNIHSKSVELQHRCDSQNLSAKGEQRIAFKVTDLRTILQAGNIVGRIETVVAAAESECQTDNASADSAADKRPNCISSVNKIADGSSKVLTGEQNSPVSTAVATSFEVSETVWSVSLLKDWICVLLRNPTSIQFHRNLSPYTIDDEMKTPLIANPWNMKSSNVSNCLYVTDRDTKCIWKVLPGDRSVTKWVSGLEDPFRVSVVDRGQVVIPRWGRRACLSLFQPDGTGIDRMYLPTNVIEPRDIVMTSSRDLVISHRWSDTKMWGVTKLTPKGQIIQKFSPTTASQNLKFPAELALDSNGCVYLADFNNDRVVVLDAELGWKTVLLTKQNDFIDRPKSLCFDDDRRRLMVAYNGKIRIVELEN